MKSKKGFTLIELLATILLIALITSIGGYFVVNTINKSKDAGNKITISSIKKTANYYASEFYVEKNWETRDSVDYTCVDLKSLVDKGYLKKDSVKNYLDSGDSTLIGITRNSTSKVITSTKFSVEKESCPNIFIKPASPEIKFTSNYNIKISSTESDATLYYAINNTNYNKFTTNINPTNETTITAYAEDKEGNRSETISKTVSVLNSTNYTISNKYYCTYTKKYYNTQAEATTACTYNVPTTQSYTGTKYYYCKETGDYSTTKSAPCQKISDRICLECNYSSSYKYVDMFPSSELPPNTDPNYCYHYLHVWRFGDNSDDCYGGEAFLYGFDFYGIKKYYYSLSILINKYIFNGTTCKQYNTPCVNNYSRTSTQSGTDWDDFTYEYLYDMGAVDFNVEQYFGRSCTKHQVADGFCKSNFLPNQTYLFDVDDSVGCYENKGTHSTSSTINVTRSTKYRCENSSSYQSSSTCYKTVNMPTTEATSTKQYCNNIYYNSLDDANKNCTNICPSGAKYNNKCYELK